MSVYNSAAELPLSLDSVLAQDGVDLELLIVDDGSTDESPGVLESYAERDDRVRVLRQDNQGLTHALVQAGAGANGEFIARQDVGDVSLPGRLAAQARRLSENPRAVFVSCGTRFLGPGGEHLYDATPSTEEGIRALSDIDGPRVAGVSAHGSVLFRRDAYENVGGYRPQFYFSQDVDLWLRLSEVGELLFMQDVLLQTSFEIESLSGLYRKEQERTVQLIMECARRRRAGIAEDEILEKASRIRPTRKRFGRGRAIAKASFFVGGCLRLRDKVAARHYFARAIKAFPFHLKSWYRLIQLSLG